MAYLYAVDGDLVTFPAVPSPISLTACGWFYLTDDTVRCLLFDSDTAANGWFCTWRGDQASDIFQANAHCGTTFSLAHAHAANFAAYGLNKWIFFVQRHNRITAGTVQMLMGDMARPAQEPSSYSTVTGGTGTAAVTTATLGIGNQVAATTREFHGSGAWVGVWERWVSNQEIERIRRQFLPGTRQQSPRVVPGNILWSPLGLSGNGPLDFSGQGRHGTATGVTRATNHPLVVKDRWRPIEDWDLRAIAAVAGRTALNTRSNPLGVEVGMGWRMPA